MDTRTYWLETLGCPKNEVDSDKLVTTLLADGYAAADSPEEADLVVVNTCAFIESARQESIDTILALGDQRREGAELVVTGCMAERYGDELAEALPEVDRIAAFGASLTASTTRVELSAPGTKSFDLLELPRSPSKLPWAYVKVAEGCDRRCGFCAIPSFRGDQRSRRATAIVDEVERLVNQELPVRELVLVAQDLASYGLDRRRGGKGEQLEVLDLAEGITQPLVALMSAITPMVERLRLLYLYPSGLTQGLIEAVLATGVPYFDLSLQHVSPPLLRRMKRWGNGDRFLERIAAIRAADPSATFRSNFILGYPGETEEDHDELLAFLEAAQLDWGGFFAFSPEEGTHALSLDRQVAPELMAERLAEVSALQDSITASRRDSFINTRLEVLVDEIGIARSVHEAPEIDGVIYVPHSLKAGTVTEVEIVDALGPDLVASGGQIQ